MGLNLTEWFLNKCSGDVIFKFWGSVSQEGIDAALNTVDEAFNLNNESTKLKKKVYHIFVECIQNLFHHSDNPTGTSGNEFPDRFGTIVLAHETDPPFRISTGNFVKNENVSRIKDRIDQVNSMTVEEIKMLYLEILGNETFSSKGGGGLGILDIARRTGNKLSYNFYPYDEGFMFFALDIYIS